MMTAKLFENGRSQAVRLPKEFRFNGNEVSINKVGDAVILLPRENKWSGFLSGLDLFTDDFMKSGREQPTVQVRESLWSICWIPIFASMPLSTNPQKLSGIF